MTDYRLKRDEETLEISVRATGTDQAKLLAAFQACQQGRCACPTNQYEKLKAVHIAADDAGISLRLEPKAGEHIEAAEIEKCLQFTTDTLDSSDPPTEGGRES